MQLRSWRFLTFAGPWRGSHFAGETSMCNSYAASVLENGQYSGTPTSGAAHPGRCQHEYRYNYTAPSIKPPPSSIVHLLLQSIADPNITDDEGLTRLALVRNIIPPTVPPSVSSSKSQMPRRLSSSSRRGVSSSLPLPVPGYPGICKVAWRV